MIFLVNVADIADSVGIADIALFCSVTTSVWKKLKITS